MSTDPIRWARESDWPSIAALLGNSGLPLDGAREVLEGFAVSERSGEIAGCAALEKYPDGYLLRSVAVRESDRGRGVGEALVAWLLRSVNSDAPVVLLTTTASNWFPRFGFREITRQEVPPSVQSSREFAGACPESATVMAVHLAAGG